MHPVKTDQAPAAIGPYSQAIDTGSLLFLSGQIALDPSGGPLPKGAAAQTRQAMENIQAVLRAAGSGLDQVVKVTVYLADMNDFAAVNEVYAGYFSGTYPARSCVEVARLPKDALVEIEVLAARPAAKEE